MKIHDILIIGDGPMARLMAERLIAEGQNVAVVALPGHPETLLAREALAFRSGTPLLPEKIQQILNLELKPEGRPLTVYPGPGQFVAKKIFQTAAEALSAKKFIIYSGCVAPRVESNHWGPLPQKAPFEILQDSPLPKTVAVVGAGARAIATAQILKNRGAEVVLVTRNSSLLPAEDGAVRTAFEQTLRAQQIPVYADENISGFKPEAVVAAEDLIPHTDGLNLAVTGAYVNPGKELVINEECRTASPFVWALGAVTDPDMDGAEEKRQAEIISENILSSVLFKTKNDLDPRPVVFPTNPPFARVGLSEREAAEKFKRDGATATFPFSKTARGILENNADGFVTLIGRKRGAQLVGAQVFGPGAEELILYFDLIIRAGIPLSEFGERNHFPATTFGEVIIQSIAAWMGKFYC